jgi:hypothetical protein
MIGSEITGQVGNVIKGEGEIFYPEIKNTLTMAHSRLREFKSKEHHEVRWIHFSYSTPKATETHCASALRGWS